MRDVPAEVEGLQQPRDREQTANADDDVGDVGDGAAEDVGDHVRVEQPDHPLVEGAEDQHQQDDR